MSGSQLNGTSENIKIDSIESAIKDIQQGKLVVVVDDEDRENEGDLITAARNATPEVINFMARFGRGLICAPVLKEKCDQYDLPMMVSYWVMDVQQVFLHKTAPRLFWLCWMMIWVPMISDDRDIYFH